MTLFDMLIVAFRDIARGLRRRGILPARRPVVRRIPRHDGSGRAWNVEDSGPLEGLLKLVNASLTPLVPASSADYQGRHRHVAPVPQNWMPAIGARRIAATLDETGVWDRAELEEMLEKVPA